MKIPKILANSVIYSIITILQKGILFFLLPLYTAYLSTDDYGVLSVITSVSSFFSIFIILSLDGAGTRFFYRNKNPQYAKILWGSLISFVLINSLIIGVLSILFHEYFIDPIVRNINFFPYILLGIVNVILSPLYLFFQTYLQTLQNGIYYGFNSLLYFLLQITLIIIFLVVFNLGIVGVLLANAITSFVFFIYVMIVFFPKVKLGFDKSILIPAIRYSSPLIPHSLSSWSTGMIDKLFLNDLAGKSETGLYSVGQQLGSIIGLMAASINKAFVPWFFEKEAIGKEGINQIRGVSEIIILICCFIAFFVSLFSKEILYVMAAKEYQNAWIIVPILAFSNVFQAMYYLFINVLFLKHSSFVFIVTIASAVINILLNIILISIAGMIGAAIACFLTLFFRSVFALILSILKNKNIRYRWVKMYLYTFTFFILSFVVYFSGEFPSASIIILKCILCVIIILPVYFINRQSFNNLKGLIENK
jgi:O-antigen/teichoic acid export membrane protein